MTSRGRRAFVLVIDACGAGELPDAAAYGDAGADTLGHLAGVVGGLELPVLGGLGLGSIRLLAGVPPASRPVLHGRLAAQGPGKDSTAGHWELMGVVASAPAPTYPDGFPPVVIGLIERLSGRSVLCNQPYNGLDAIADFGAEHLSTGSVIVYTSQDSVLQLAAHEDQLAPGELAVLCQRVRAELPPEHPVGRVIARPFTGVSGDFARLPGRLDLGLRPPTRSYLDELGTAGVPVHAVGKAGQLFAGVGIDEQHPGATNAEALAATRELVHTLETGFVLTNLIETDQVYGHRHDAPGFHRALQGIDAELGRWAPLLGPGDLLVITADHGCDVTAAHTDHTREHVPLLASFAGHGSRRHDGPMADVGASALRWLTGRDSPLPGDPFVPGDRGA
jgi:phosphopentomutase